VTLGFVATNLLHGLLLLSSTATATTTTTTASASNKQHQDSDVVMPMRQQPPRATTLRANEERSIVGNRSTVTNRDRRTLTERSRDRGTVTSHVTGHESVTSHVTCHQSQVTCYASRHASRHKISTVSIRTSLTPFKQRPIPIP
jgi:hypothetical protein